jgi:outer membrane protein assembly factor BamB
MVRHDAMGTSRSTIVGPSSVTIGWIDDDVGTDLILGAVLAADGTMYTRRLVVSTEDGSYAADDGCTTPAGPPAIGADGSRYLLCNDSIDGGAGLLAATAAGDTIWRFGLSSGSTSDYDASPLLGDDGSIYAVGPDGTLHVLRPDGTPREPSVSGLSADLHVCVGSDGTVFGMFGYFGAYGASGTKIWGSTIVGGGCLLDNAGLVYVAAEHLDALATSSGHEMWSASANVMSPLALGADGTVYAAGEGGFVAFRNDGTMAWAQALATLPTSLVIGGDGTIYTGQMAFSPDGVMLWDLSSAVPGGSSFTPLAIGADGSLYVAIGTKLHVDMAGPSKLVALRR